MMPLIIPKYLTVKTAAGSVAAFLSPESDGLKDAVIERELNGKSTLTFSLPILPGSGADVPVLTVKGVMPTVDVPDPNDKWQYLTDQYRIYAPDIAGQMREFVILNPDAIDKERDGKKLWGKVTAHESWVLLGKKYATISNDPQTPDPPPLAVIILSGGSDLSGGRYPVGSAGHALYAILQGTGWSVGTVDVEGTHDLETEKISILENINKIQEIWGGYIVWDSVNKTVSLRSETAWAPYTGYQVRYAKNLKGITRTSDYDIITKLYPFGENDLNIGSVNGGVIYLTNNTYTNEVLEGIWVNQDIADPQKLKDEATKYLAKVCKPRHNYRVKQVDLRLLSGYTHEDFDLGHLVDVIDEDLGINTKARIIGYKYNVFQPWQCELEVGDPIEKIESMLVDSKEMVNYLNSIKTSRGQITAYKLVDESIIAQKIAKAAVDATRLNTKTVILLGDTWTDNSPAPGYVSWNQHKLYYAGREYVITAGNTNQKYIYWDGSSSSYSTSATEPNLTDGQFIIAVNNGGLHDIVWNKGYARQFIGSAFIGDGVIKSAHIGEAQILDAHIANVSANKITTGQLLAYLVEILGQNGYFKITGDGLRVYDDVGNLKGHLGWYETLGDQTAQFSRSSVAYKQDGTQVAANQPRFEPGKFGQAVMVEEGTTNLLLYSEDFTQSAWNKTRVNVSSAGTYLGYPVTRFTPNTPGQVSTVDQTFLASGAANRTFTWSFWARGQTNRQFGVNFYGGVSGTFVSYTINLTTEWQKFTITHTFPSNATSARIQWGNSTPYWGVDYTDWIEVAGVQVEEKPYATSYIKTTSSTATRSPETLTIPTAGVLNPQEGTVECWVYVDPNVHKVTGSDWNMVFVVCDTLTGEPNQLRFGYNRASGKWHVKTSDSAGTVWYAEYTVASGWHHFALTWNKATTTAKMFVDGVVVASNTAAPLPSAFASVAYIGSWISGIYQLNSLIDDLRISSRARTDEEIAAAYSSGLPLPVD